MLNVYCDKLHVSLKIYGVCMLGVTVTMLFHYNNISHCNLECVRHLQVSNPLVHLVSYSVLVYWKE